MREYYIARLEEEFLRRRKANPAYSLRAYARFLGIHAPTLSCVIRGRRPLPLASLEKIVVKLRLSPIEKRRFCESVYIKRTRDSVDAPASRDDRFVLSEEEHYRIIAEWEHYAILSLMEVRGFDPNPKWIAKRLGISELQARSAFERLLQAGLIERVSKAAYVKKHAKLRTTEDELSSALQKSHIEALRMAARKLETEDVHSRDFWTISFATSRDQVAKAKELIREFRQQLSELMESGPKTDVYELAIQLYPLSSRD